MIPVATAAFNDSMFAFIGIVIFAFANFLAGSLAPLASLPMINATGWVKSVFQHD